MEERKKNVVKKPLEKFIYDAALPISFARASYEAKKMRRMRSANYTGNSNELFNLISSVL